MKIEDTGYSILYEGVKIGNAQLNQVLTLPVGTLTIGIEYEFKLPESVTLDHEDQVEWMKDFINTHKIGSIGNVVTEHDGMIEVITQKMPMNQGIGHIQRFLKLLVDNQFVFPEYSSMHVSLSHKDHVAKDINIPKFAVLLSADYLSGIFPEREYVQNMNRFLRDAVTRYVYETYGTHRQVDITDIEGVIRQRLTGEEYNTKHITAKFSDYFTSDGRIELRFMGGENYWKRFKTLIRQILRAGFLLGVAYDDKMYRKEYLKKLYEFVPDADDMKVYSLYRGLVQHDDLTKNQQSLAFTKAKESPAYALEYSTRIMGENIPEIKTYLYETQSREFIDYLRHFNLGDPDSEKLFIDVIKEKAERSMTPMMFWVTAIMYISETLQHRVPEIESSFERTLSLASRYTKDVLVKFHPDEHLKLPGFEQKVLSGEIEIDARIEKDRLRTYIMYAYPDGNPELEEYL